MSGCHVSLSTFPSFFIRSSADFPPTTKRAKKAFCIFQFSRVKAVWDGKIGRNVLTLISHNVWNEKKAKKEEKRASLGERERSDKLPSAPKEKRNHKKGNSEWRRKKKNEQEQKSKKFSRIFCSQSFEISKRHTQKNYFWPFEQKGQQGHSSKIV